MVGLAVCVLEGQPQSAPSPDFDGDVSCFGAVACATNIRLCFFVEVFTNYYGTPQLHPWENVLANNSSQHKRAQEKKY